MEQEYPYAYNVIFDGVLHDAEEFTRYAIYNIHNNDGKKLCHFQIEFDSTEIIWVDFLNCANFLPKETFKQIQEMVYDEITYEVMVEEFTEPGEW
jgi:hypothetical protein